MNLHCQETGLLSKFASSAEVGHQEWSMRAVFDGVRRRAGTPSTIPSISARGHRTDIINAHSPAPLAVHQKTDLGSTSSQAACKTRSPQSISLAPT